MDQFWNWQRVGTTTMDGMDHVVIDESLEGGEISFGDGVFMNEEGVRERVRDACLKVICRRGSRFDSQSEGGRLGSGGGRESDQEGADCFIGEEGGDEGIGLEATEPS